MIIICEEQRDLAAIRELVRRAFSVAPRSNGTEPAIIDALRAADALTISLVAIADGAIVGHVAASPVGRMKVGQILPFGIPSVHVVVQVKEVDGHSTRNVGGATLVAFIDLCGALPVTPQAAANADVRRSIHGAG